MSVVPEVIGDESGDRWYAEGHHDPAVMVLAVLVEEATLTDDETCIDLLLNRSRGQRVDQVEGMRNAEHLIGCVRHIWAKPDEHDEMYLPCKQDDDGAEPWTELGL